MRATATTLWCDQIIGWCNQLKKLLALVPPGGKENISLETHQPTNRYLESKYRYNAVQNNRAICNCNDYFTHHYTFVIMFVLADRSDEVMPLLTQGIFITYTIESIETDVLHTTTSNTDVYFSCMEGRPHSFLSFKNCIKIHIFESRKMCINKDRSMRLQETTHFQRPIILLRQTTQATHSSIKSLWGSLSRGEYSYGPYPFSTRLQFTKVSAGIT